VSVDREEEAGTGVDRKEAARVAELARLALGEAELEALAGDLSRILDHVRVVQAVAPAAGEAAGTGGAGPDGATAMDGPDAVHYPIYAVAPDERAAHDQALEVVTPDEREAQDHRPEVVAQIPPDPLAHPLKAIVPDFRDGFFVVPPPPGVQSGEGGRSSGRSGNPPAAPMDGVPRLARRAHSARDVHRPRAVVDRRSLEDAARRALQAIRTRESGPERLNAFISLRTSRCTTACPGGPRSTSTARGRRSSRSSPSPTCARRPRRGPS